MPTHEYTRPARVTVQTGGPLEVLAEFVMVVAPVAAAAFVLYFVAQWVVAYAIVLGIGLALACGVVVAEVWILHRFCTVLVFRRGVRPARLAAPVAARAAVAGLTQAELASVRHILAAMNTPAVQVIETKPPIQVPYVITDAVPVPRKELP
jgi:hypothetical protein